MRWKLLRRKWSVSAPRMIVRSHLPWPLRWAVVALMLGFSAALALWAFEFGREVAGIDKTSRTELKALRMEVQSLRDSQAKSETAANAAQSLLTSERAAQDVLAQKLLQAELENRSLQEDLGFFERLLPAGNAAGGLTMRGLQVEASGPGQLRYQLLVMQGDKTATEFAGGLELVLSGQAEGRTWNSRVPASAQPLRLKAYQRVVGVIDHPPGVQLRQVQARVLDTAGAVRATQVLRL